MPVITLFVTTPELEEVIRNFANRHSLTGCLHISGEYKPFDPSGDALGSFTDWGSVSRAYLFPDAKASKSCVLGKDVQPVQKGWVTIEPGKLVKTQSSDLLTATTISAEDKKHLTTKPATWLRRLRHDLCNSMVFGVEGTNTVSKASSVYNIAYSAEALRLYQSGVQWKQFVDGNVNFLPIDQGKSKEQ